MTEYTVEKMAQRYFEEYQEGRPGTFLKVLKSRSGSSLSRKSGVKESPARITRYIGAAVLLGCGSLGYLGH